ncbi:MAG: NifB/NifX family molybdenum-iron cluster-binding protein [Dehalococcoidales bacterium]|nr:NifB/NifX family molybdenum-iron cluster-binding protein [Dehalococcoidales bacterium]
MKYAVPVSGGMLSQHFGHCEQFALIDVNEETSKIISKKLVPSPGHEPGFLPGWLAGEGVSVVIAGGMGSRAQELFDRNRIKVVANVLESDPERAVMSYLAGTLKTGGDACDH